jgi:hypothetical protein
MRRFQKNVVSLRRASAGSGVQTLLETRDIGSLPGYLKPPNLQAPQAGRQCPCIKARTTVAVGARRLAVPRYQR